PTAQTRTWPSGERRRRAAHKPTSAADAALAASRIRNDIVAFLSHASCGGRQRGASGGEAAAEGWNIEHREAVVAEPLQVGGEYSAQVRYAVFQHGEPVEAHAEREALVLLRVEPAVAQHVWMNHAAAENFEPLTGLADRFRADID